MIRWMVGVSVCLLALAGCGGQGAAGSRSSAPETASNPVGSAPTSNASLALIKAYISKQHHGAEAEISTDEVPRLPLEGLELYRAWPKMPDALATACFVRGSDLWCNDAPKALENVVKAFGLGEAPQKLSDAEWLALVSFANGAPIVKSWAEAKQRVSSLPEDKGKDIAPPKVTRSGDRVEVVLYTLIIANDAGPVGVSKCVTTVTKGSVEEQCDRLHHQF